jgi:hypothetical protein
MNYLDTRAAWRVLSHDVGFMALMIGVIVAWLVSTPATYATVQPFHSDFIVFGLLMIVLIEFAAVVCKLITLVVPEFSLWLNTLVVVLLCLAGFANYAHGRDLFMQAPLGTTFGELRTAGYGDLAAVVYSGLVPVFLFTFLSLATARAKRLLYHLDELEVERRIAPVRDAVRTVVLMQHELIALGAVERPALTAAVLPAPAAPPATALPGTVREYIRQQTQRLLEAEPGLGAAALAIRLGTSADTVRRALEETKEERAQSTATPAVESALLAAESAEGATDAADPATLLDTMLHTASMTREQARDVLARYNVKTAERAYAGLKTLGKLPQGMTLDQFGPLYDELVA